MDELTKIFNIDPTLEAALNDAAESGEPLRLGNATYRLWRINNDDETASDDDIWAEYDPDEVARILDTYADCREDLDPEILNGKASSGDVGITRIDCELQRSPG